MIVPMQKVTVVCLAHTQEETLLQLRALGVLHVQAADKPQHASAADVAAQIRDTDMVIEVLRQYSASAEATSAPPAAAVDARTLVRELLSLRERMAQREEARARVQAHLAELAVWGDFNPQDVAALRARGVHVALYSCSPAEMPAIPAGCAVHEIRRTNDAVAFLLVSAQPVELPVAALPLPEKSPAALRAELAAREQEQADDQAEIAAQARWLPALQQARLALDDTLHLAQARDATGRVEALAYLQGFVPADAVTPFEAAARAHGWGLLVSAPGPDDDVPTLIRNPHWLRPVETVFNFIDTFPGYRERDISGVFYLFFSLFYAMLIGDAGYAVIFLAITAGVHVKYGRRIPAQPLYLMYVLNSAMLIWGVLTGGYFGMTLPQGALLGKLVVINSSDFHSVVSLCFIIAAVQLTIAHLWNFVRMMNSPKGLEQLGWAGIIIFMYFVANKLILDKPFPAPVGYVGIGLLVVTFGLYIYDKRGEDLIAGVIQFPFSVINCFGDIASYIRLFAVGFAGVATSLAFNGIAEQVGMNTVLTGFIAALILVLGHALNMVLGLLAVLVHGLRLNTLEFSGHLGQEWSGSRYQPLAQQAGARAEEVHSS
jgi:V/A-type H+-transporting ATPase subunit I